MSLVDIDHLIWQFSSILHVDITINVVLKHCNRQRDQFRSGP